MSDRVVIKEVAPRDGLQAQPKHLTVEQRQRLIASLMAAGLPEIEIGSFVSPKAVPQMAGTDEIANALPQSDCEFSALVPNMRGYELALAASIRTQAIVVSATEQMNQNNIRMSLDETFAMAESILTRSREDDVAIHAYLAVAFECPYEGKVDPEVVIAQAEQLMAHQPARLVIADTIGAADPMSVRRLMDSLVARFGTERIACHFHDTRALAIANVYAALESGVRHFDSAAGGLGGCPFAPGAKGNVATEDVVLLCEQSGLSTGINIERLLESVALLSDFIGTPQGGRGHYWLSKNWQNLLR